MPIAIALALLLTACAPRFALDAGPPSLLPPGTAVAVQPAAGSITLTGRVAFISADKLILHGSGAGLRELRRDEVAALYRRPPPRLGLTALLGAAAGAALGSKVAAGACGQGRLPNCDRGYYGEDPVQLPTILGAVPGAVLLGVVGQRLDPGAEGLDPSAWVPIPWPEPPP